MNDGSPIFSNVGDLMTWLEEERRKHPIRTRWLRFKGIVSEWRRRITDAIPYFWQRNTRGFTDSDWWDFHHYIAGVMVKGLDEFIKRDGGMGHPESLTQKEWVDILKELREFFFRLHRNDIEDWDWIEKNYNKKMKLFTKWFRNLWD